MAGLWQAGSRWLPLPLQVSPKESDEAFVLYVCTAVGLVLMAGLMSGLTLGLMSLDAVQLQVLKRSGTEREQKYAERISPVVKRPHLLLVTLVLCNAAANEALPLVLDRLADPVTAVLVSIVVVLLFGEIIPQAICSRYGLAVGAYSAGFVQILIWVFGFIAYPISKLLDWTLGQDHTALFRRAQLKALMEVHSSVGGLGGYLTADEVNVVRGALDLTAKQAVHCMTPIDKVFMLPADGVLDETTLQRILNKGYSRVPIYHTTRTHRHEILGLILVKELIMLDKQAATPLTRIKMRSMPYLRSDVPLYDVLKLFETGRSHMAVLLKPEGPALSRTASAAVAGEQGHESQEIQIRVSDSMENGHVVEEIAEPIGIITIEDIIEELIQSEIIDETDQYVDNEQSQRVNAGMMVRNLPPRLRKLLASRQFQPRVGPLAATGGRAHWDDAAVTGREAEQRLRQAIDLLTPLLATDEPTSPAGGSQAPTPPGRTPRNSTDRRSPRTASGRDGGQPTSADRRSQEGPAVRGARRASPNLKERVSPNLKERVSPRPPLSPSQQAPQLHRGSVAGELLRGDSAMQQRNGTAEGEHDETQAGTGAANGEGNPVVDADAQV